MKLGPASKLDKRNITPSKENDDYIMSKNYDIIVSHFFDLWTIWSNSEAEFQMHSHIRLTFSLIVTFYLTKTETEIKYL